MRDSHTSRLAHDARRDQLIREGVELLGRQGYDQMSVSELARAAGTSKGLLYHYFPTKSDFVVAVLRQAREQLEQRMTIDDPALDAPQRLEASLDAFLGYVEEHAAGFQAIARARYGEDDGIRAEMAEGRRRRVDQLVNFAAALCGCAREQVESTALETAIVGWLAYCEEVAVMWLSRRELSRDAVRHMLVQAALSALVAAGQAGGAPAADRLRRSALDALLRNDAEAAAHERVDPAEVRVGAG